MNSADRIRSEGAPCVGGASDGYYFVKPPPDQLEETTVFIKKSYLDDSYGYVYKWDNAQKVWRCLGRERCRNEEEAREAVARLTKQG